MYITVEVGDVLKGCTVKEMEELKCLISQRLEFIRGVQLMDDEVALVRGGSNVRAITLIRARTGISLHDVKDIVDRFAIQLELERERRREDAVKRSWGKDLDEDLCRHDDRVLNGMECEGEPI